MPSTSSVPSLKFAVPAMALAALLVGGCDRQSGQNAQPPAQASASAGAGESAGEGSQLDRSHKGEAMPALTFRDPAGKQITLASFKGKPLLVNLWATWCAPCVAELPTLNALAGRDAAKLKVLTVSEDLGEPAKVGEFLKAKGLDKLEPWLDPDNAATSQYQLTTLPATIFYDAEGREVWRLTGGHDWTGPEAAALLAE